MSPRGCDMGAECRFQHQKPNTVVTNGGEPKPTRRAALLKPNPNVLIECKEKEYENVVKTFKGFTLKLKKKVLIQSHETEETGVASSKRPHTRREPVRKPQPKTLESMLEQCTSFDERASVMKNFQVDQLLTRFPESVRKWTPQGLEFITFEMKPSDPDFPFDLEKLELVLYLNRYPSRRDAQIIVKNSEIPSDLKMNIQKGFRKQEEFDVNGSLLDLFKWLDRNLESLLISKKKSTNDRDIGIVAFVKPKDASESQRRAFYERVQIESEETNSDSIDYETNGLSEDEEDKFSSDEEEEFEESLLQDTTTLINTGTSIRLSNLNLDKISLLAPYTLSITVKCNRCKNLDDFLQLKPNGDGKLDWASLSCRKCNELLVVNFRPDLVHVQNSQLGYLDCVGCIVHDILPSKLLATCDQCGTIQNSNSCFETIGSSIHCRGCHCIMTLNASQFRFVTIQPVGQGASSAAIAAASRGKKLAKKNQKEGISLGNPLPKNGVCAHYKKSYRWFRFPCCGKLYPCDICHEESNNDSHVMEWATRQVCGFCSREQTYSQSKPCVCGKDMIAKANQGFWEGGKGTRDRTKMNRNDSHKFQGIRKTMSNRAKDKLKIKV